MPRVASADVSRESSPSGNGAYCAATSGRRRTAVTWWSGVSGRWAGKSGAKRDRAWSSAPSARERTESPAVSVGSRSAMACNRSSGRRGDQEAKPPRLYHAGRVQDETVASWTILPSTIVRTERIFLISASGTVK